MARLPEVGGDDGNWGEILNDFLAQSLDSAGALKAGSVTNPTLADESISEAKLDSGLVTKINTHPTSPVLSVNNKTGNITLNQDDIGLEDVDNTRDADKPISTATQTALGTKEAAIATGTTSQYWRGDKSWQTVNKATVGLSSVDNVSVSEHGMGVVVHGAAASTVRPTGFACITWIGSVTPTNAAANDIWIYKA